jgi:hypothetical protein
MADEKDLKEKEKLKSDKISKRISKFKKNMKEPVFMKMSTDMKKRAVLDNPEVDASKFPGYDQANRIRGGLRKGGSAKKKKSSRKALRGGGCEIR